MLKQGLEAAIEHVADFSEATGAQTQRVAVLEQGVLDLAKQHAELARGLREHSEMVRNLATGSAELARNTKLLCDSLNDVIRASNQQNEKITGLEKVLESVKVYLEKLKGHCELNSQNIAVIANQIDPGQVN